MADTINFDDARRRLDRALEQIAAEEAAEAGPGAAEGHAEPRPGAGAPAPPPAHPADDEPVARQGPASQTSEALTRLVVGAAVLGLDALAARSGTWERRADAEQGGAPPRSSAVEIPVRDLGAGRFRHGLIGWVFESEEELRPSGNPLRWLQRVAGHLSTSVFAVVFDSLPRLGPRRRRGAAADPDQDTARWVARGQREELRSRAFAAAALDDIVNQAIPYLARQRGVQQAVAELVRSPAMDDAIVALARRDGVQRAVAELVRSPAMDDAIVTLARRDGVQQAVAELVRSPMVGDALRTVVRSEAMEDAITHIVGTEAMNEAIETLSRSPALVRLVQTQSTSIIGEIVEEVRERGEGLDDGLEGLARRLLRRPPRALLPQGSRGLVVVEPARRGIARREP